MAQSSTLSLPVHKLQEMRSNGLDLKAYGRIALPLQKFRIALYGTTP